MSASSLTPRAVRNRIAALTLLKRWRIAATATPRAIWRWRSTTATNSPAPWRPDGTHSTSPPIAEPGSRPERHRDRRLSVDRPCVRPRHSGRPDGRGVDQSFSPLTPADIKAVVVYLRSIPQITSSEPATIAPPAPPSPKQGGETPEIVGKRVFKGACASCHGWTGVSAIRLMPPSRVPAPSTIRRRPMWRKS